MHTKCQGIEVGSRGLQLDVIKSNFAFFHFYCHKSHVAWDTTSMNVASSVQPLLIKLMNLF